MHENLSPQPSSEPQVVKLYGEKCREVQQALQHTQLFIDSSRKIQFEPNLSENSGIELDLSLRRGSHSDILVVTVLPRDESERSGLIFDVDDLDVELHALDSGERASAVGIVLEQYPNQLRFAGVEEGRRYVFSFPGDGDVPATLPEDPPTPSLSDALPRLSEVRGPEIIREQERERDLVAAVG